jgi:hypothetical protein
MLEGQVAHKPDNLSRYIREMGEGVRDVVLCGCMACRIMVMLAFVGRLIRYSYLRISGVKANVTILDSEPILPTYLCPPSLYSLQRSLYHYGPHVVLQKSGNSLALGFDCLARKKMFSLAYMMLHLANHKRQPHVAA